MRLYRFPSQTSCEFVEFINKLDNLWTNIEKENPFLTITMGDFNARCSNWWSKDIDNQWGVEIDSIASFNCQTQLIDSPTHILPNSLSCIDLIFCTQPSLIKESSVHPSLYQTCHHQIIHAKLDFQIVLTPVYERKVWNYKKAKSERIQKKSIIC